MTKLKKKADKFNVWLIQAYRSVFFIILDIFIVNFAAMLALVLRFDFQIPDLYYATFQKGLPWMIAFTLVLNGAFGLYKSLWKYASVDELVTIMLACMMSTFTCFFFLNWQGIVLPKSFFIIYGLMIMALMGGIRFTYRLLRYLKNVFDFSGKKGKKRVLIFGAGKAGQVVVDEMVNQGKMDYLPIGFIDDNPAKKSKRIHSIPILGTREDLEFIVKSENVDEIIIAVPSANKTVIKEIFNVCKNTKCKVKTLPGIYELIDGRVGIKQIRDVSIEDLLGREPVKVDLDGMCEFIHGKTVLVTGGGGSIGSELCRQVMKYRPKQLVIFDIYENNAYEIQNELIKKHGTDHLTTLIGSVRDEKRLEEVFQAYKPSLIFHAAAHKHVPLMENSPVEAIKNNVFGTYNVAKKAHQHKAEKMVLISTDKAVNPTNIMGATKRFAERVISAFDGISETEYVSVRFGNVLGSNGSVIPLFKKQIETGGPVTVTHPEIYRYFMTIPEAVQLVLQAGAMAEGGEIFVLDMGESVKILSLAEDLIRLSGFEPYTDIDIAFSGLRPGEKLYEELLHAEEGLEKTKHDKIYVGRHFSEELRVIESSLEEIQRRLGMETSPEFVIEVLKTMVPTYVFTPNSTINNGLEIDKTFEGTEKLAERKVLKPVTIN